MPGFIMGPHRVGSATGGMLDAQTLTCFSEPGVVQITSHASGYGPGIGRIISDAFGYEHVVASMGYDLQRCEDESSAFSSWGCFEWTQRHGTASSELSYGLACWMSIPSLAAGPRLALRA